MTRRRGSRLRILVLGVDSTPDPYAGIGVARSLRQAFPDAELVALDHTPASSGLYWTDFDSHKILTSNQALAGVCSAMCASDYLIACADDDIRWLARSARGRHVLTPDRTCLRRLRKPSRSIARLLQAGVPSSLVIPAEPRVAARFIAACESGIWLKGLWSGAERITSREALGCARRVPEAYRGERGRALLQAHIPGSRVALSFCAYQGRLLESVCMTKLGVTRQGKAWSGTVSKPSTELQARLARVARDFTWHGGGDFELICDGNFLWLVDANPRFAAWIHGATLAGTNLPAALVAAASGHRPLARPANGTTFTRVVLETPVPAARAGQIAPHTVE